MSSKYRNKVTDLYQKDIQVIIDKATGKEGKEFWWVFYDDGDYGNIGEWRLITMMTNRWAKVGESEAVIAGFRLSEMPGCCGVCVANGAYVNAPFDHKGLGTILNKMRLDLAAAGGFGCVIATDRTYNDYNNKIFTKNGWKHLGDFENPRTGNNVTIRIHEVEGVGPDDDDDCDDNDGGLEDDDFDDDNYN